MLQPIVTHDHIAAGRNDRSCRSEAIRRNKQATARRLMQQYRLITNLTPIGYTRHSTRLLSLAAIPARDNGHVPAARRKRKCKPRRKWCFARAACREIPDNDDGTIYLVGLKPPCTERESPCAGQRAVKP